MNISNIPLNVGDEFYIIVVKGLFPKEVFVVKKRCDSIIIKNNAVCVCSDDEEELIDNIFLTKEIAVEKAKEKIKEIREVCVEYKETNGEKAELIVIKNNPDRTTYKCSLCGKVHYSSWSGSVKDGDVCECGAILKIRY